MNEPSRYCEHCYRFPHLSNCPNAPDPPDTHCPMCGKECEDFYIVGGNDVVGCDNCVTRKEAWEHN